MKGKMERLEAAARACHEKCSDYSCVRSGHCTGHAGHELEDYRRELRSRARLRHVPQSPELRALRRVEAKLKAIEHRLATLESAPHQP